MLLYAGDQFEVIIIASGISAAAAKELGLMVSCVERSSLDSSAGSSALMNWPLSPR